MLILAVSLSGMIAFILALWWMHVFTFVWSGLKHCRQWEDELNCATGYQPGTAREVEMNLGEVTGATALLMMSSNTACGTNTTTNMKTLRNASTNDLRASKLIEICQAKINSLEANVNWLALYAKACIIVTNRKCKRCSHYLSCFILIKFLHRLRTFT